MSFLAVLENIYRQFLNFFPEFFRPFVSFGLGVLLIYSVFQTIKKNIIFFIVLIVLLPAVIPILKDLLSTVLEIVSFLFGVK